MSNSAMEAKVVLLGSQGVGKTSLVVRFIRGVFESSVPSTIGASFFTHKITCDGCRVKLQIWDTAGQERFRSMAPMYYRGSDAALILYDVTRPSSFDDLDEWVKNLEKHTNNAVVTILANKVDKEEAMTELIKKGKAYARSIGADFVETSALTEQGIEEAFLMTVRRLIQRQNPEQTMDDDETVDMDSDKEQPVKQGCCS